MHSTDGVCPACLLHAVTLSQDGRELWTATEGNSGGGVSVTGYRRVVVGEKWQWKLTHSFAALSGLSLEAQTSRMVLHLLPASRCIAVVCSNGLVYVLCIEDTAAPPLRIPLVRPLLLATISNCVERIYTAAGSNPARLDRSAAVHQTRHA